MEHKYGKWTKVCDLEAVGDCIEIKVILQTAVQLNLYPFEVVLLKDMKNVV